jgi:hypothetical protein
MNVFSISSNRAHTSIKQCGNFYVISDSKILLSDHMWTETILDDIYQVDVIVIRVAN